MLGLLAIGTWYYMDSDQLTMKPASMTGFRHSTLASGSWSSVYTWRSLLLAGLLLLEFEPDCELQLYVCKVSSLFV